MDLLLRDILLLARYYKVVVKCTCACKQSSFSQDGCLVPLTVCYRTDLAKQDGTAPLLVHVYGKNVNFFYCPHTRVFSAGCYGENLNMAYRPEKQPLLNRGWVLAYCHVRGGGELGRKWYYDGMGENKLRSFMVCIYIYTHRSI